MGSTDNDMYKFKQYTKRPTSLLHMIFMDFIENDETTSIKTQDDLAYYQKNILDGHIVEFDFSGFES